MVLNFLGRPLFAVLRLLSESSYFQDAVMSPGKQLPLLLQGEECICDSDARPFVSHQSVLVQDKCGVEGDDRGLIIAIVWIRSGRMAEFSVQKGALWAPFLMT